MSNMAMRRAVPGWPATRPPTTHGGGTGCPARLCIRRTRSARCSGIDSPERITDDCPRCGWHGHFHHYITTIDQDWAAAVCDNCYADLHPGIMVPVTFYAARVPRFDPRAGEPVAVIRSGNAATTTIPISGISRTSGSS
jgi:RNase P subunit RPR2